MSLELYYFTACPFCQRVLQKIKELGLEDKIIYKDIHVDPENAKYHQTKTNRMTTPCLYIDSTPMFESADINQWLENNAEKIKG